MASIRRRKRAKRDVYLVDYFDGAGVRRRLTAATRREAEDLLADKIKESREGAAPSPDHDITLAEYAARWLDQVALDVKPRTHQGYEAYLRRHILPTLGSLPVRAVTRRVIKTLLAEKAKTGLGKNSIRLIRAALSACLSGAVDDEIIRANPAFGLGRRGARRADVLTPAERQKRIRPLSGAQLTALLGAAQAEPRYFPVFALLAMTGMRPGEAFGLRWEDVNFADRKIYVERTWSAGRLETPKSGKTRVVDMSAQLAVVLRKVEADRKAEKVRRGWPNLPATVFCTETGTPLDESKVRKVFRRALKKAGLPPFRLYDLRHTFASLLLANGVPITYVSAQLGHDDATTTLRWYARWLPAAETRAVDLLDEALPRRPWHQSGTISRKLEVSEGEVPEIVGAERGTRTRDLPITNRLLYQLS
jgi:integrase